MSEARRPRQATIQVSKRAAAATRWVAPSKGGYSGGSASGKPVTRPASPPTNPASGSFQRKSSNDS